MDLEPPATDEEWARYFGEVRTVPTRTSQNRTRQIADIVDDVAAGRTSCKKNSGYSMNSFNIFYQDISSQNADFCPHLGEPPRIPKVSSIAQHIMAKFCAKLDTMSAEEREKLERPLLESLSRQPKLPDPPQHRGESTDEEHQHIRNKRRGGRRKLPKSVNCQLSKEPTYANRRLQQLSSVLSTPLQTDTRCVSAAESESTLRSSFPTATCSANSTFQSNQSVSDLFSTTTLDFSADGPTPSQLSSRSTASSTDQSIWTSSILAGRAENESAGLDEELDVTPPPSQRSQTFSVESGREVNAVTPQKKALTKQNELHSKISPTWRQLTLQAQKDKAKQSKQPSSEKKAKRATRNLCDVQPPSKPLNATVKVQSWIAKNKSAAAEVGNKKARPGKPRRRPTKLVASEPVSQGNHPGKPRGRSRKVVAAKSVSQDAKHQKLRLRPFLPRKSKK